MARPHVEFVQATDVPAEPVRDRGFAGTTRRLLSADDADGAWTGLVRCDPAWQGMLGGHSRPTELYVLRGSVELEGRRLGPGGYAYHPGTGLTPLAASDGALLLTMVEPEGERDGGVEVMDPLRVRYRPSGRHADIPPGIVNKLLRIDPVTGDETWIAAVVPGWTETRAEIHPTVEECLMIRGDILLGGRGAMGPGSYFWRPPLVRHGPMYSRDGGLFFFRSKGGRLGVEYEEVPGWEEVVDSYARGRPYFDPGPAPRFRKLVDGLLRLTAATRVTVRLEDETGGFPVVAEALAQGARSIAGDSSIDLRAAPTFQYLERELRPLIQDDILDSDTAPPPELIARYGARAQMIAPVVCDGRMVGFVSVHYAEEPRHWTPEEIGAIESAATRVAATVGSRGSSA